MPFDMASLLSPAWDMGLATNCAVSFRSSLGSATDMGASTPEPGDGGSPAATAMGCCHVHASPDFSSSPWLPQLSSCTVDLKKPLDTISESSSPSTYSSSSTLTADLSVGPLLRECHTEAKEL